MRHEAFEKELAPDNFGQQNLDFEFDLGDDFDVEAEVPEQGELYFRFVSLRKPPWAGGDTELHHTVFDALKEHFSNNTKPLAGEHRVGKIEFLQVCL